MKFQLIMYSHSFLAGNYDEADQAKLGFSQLNTDAAQKATFSDSGFIC